MLQLAGHCGEPQVSYRYAGTGPSLALRVWQAERPYPFYLSSLHKHNVLCVLCIKTEKYSEIYLGGLL